MRAILFALLLAGCGTASYLHQWGCEDVKVHTEGGQGLKP